MSQLPSLNSIDATDNSIDATDIVAPDGSLTGFLRMPQVLALVPVSRSTLWRHVASGAFPAPVKLFFGVTAWRVDDVRHWIEAQGGASSASQSGGSYKRVRATPRTQAASDTGNADEHRRNHARRPARARVAHSAQPPGVSARPVRQRPS
ncbi:AlpA family phage regulatory protein [Paenacidovorax monticola]|uniref:AlpA family phage regulatory protein n=2 Tax=Paenacidovorax monticola TaxID=1926868 RepID=A0A7H0HHP3_9BURK|nr:AlpA family phage regulatory protein [Paenacidovorax monticola]